ncbi:MAG: DNA-directed RNA polymerase subunit P [Thermoproteota archaeon]|jgi:DNA-directed RNA polymerase subunit P|uniref:DNA-directed RNA polymerase subunit Rpo12 n=1 Tax=Candidatus Methanodesulfokora washburnensis TaxID=2478471 RepID=A0A3R9QW24_9CREN|nr:DNA-directed RNA polymerase subunit P [Candidatus Methanodesulfokores washburnensis]RSN73581.1 DNA-directed RNA polymerase subunit P [Candidatus Methanodesulfokores washburnensis]RZN58213.1 MAG: DNA-directed RNA polymerase subunit P [Candidatus Methanodesulfokores washburnensis]TDA39878.1 MAG: DNA-directed RNA polymerase subunit P [Candidatus Korarchaeota archaeon]
MYECMRCGYVFSKSEMEEFFKDYKCPRCGYRIIKKVRKEDIKRVKAI